MKKAEIEVYEKLHLQIKGIYSELGILSKKAPDSAINKFKLKFVNQLISEANLLLGDEYKPFNDFILFDTDDMPSNSDIVLVISQYISCLERMKGDNVYRDLGKYYWKIDNSKDKIETTRPNLE